jgi:hypothetical protein
MDKICDMVPGSLKLNPAVQNALKVLGTRARKWFTNLRTTAEMLQFVTTLGSLYAPLAKEAVQAAVLAAPHKERQSIYRGKQTDLGFTRRRLKNAAIAFMNAILLPDNYADAAAFALAQTALGDAVTNDVVWDLFLAELVAMMFRRFMETVWGDLSARVLAKRAESMTEAFFPNYTTDVAAALTLALTEFVVLESVTADRELCGPIADVVTALFAAPPSDDTADHRGHTICTIQADMNKFAEMTKPVMKKQIELKTATEKAKAAAEAAAKAAAKAKVHKQDASIAAAGSFAFKEAKPGPSTRGQVQQPAYGRGETRKRDETKSKPNKKSRNNNGNGMHSGHGSHYGQRR